MTNACAHLLHLKHLCLELGHHLVTTLTCWRVQDVKTVGPSGTQWNYFTRLLLQTSVSILQPGCSIREHNFPTPSLYRVFDPIFKMTMPNELRSGQYVLLFLSTQLHPQRVKFPIHAFVAKVCFSRVSGKNVRHSGSSFRVCGVLLGSTYLPETPNSKTPNQLNPKPQTPEQPNPKPQNPKP